MALQEQDIASAIFERLRASFPSLAMTFDDNPEDMDLTFDIPEQDGLLFDVHLNLQNVDELHLCAGALWFSWFPCTDPERAEAFFDAVSGLLSGHWRVLEHWRGTSLAKAQLQRPENDSWKTIATSAPFPPFPWPRKIFKVVRNLPAADQHVGSAPESDAQESHQTRIDAQEVECIRGEVRRLISRRNYFVLWAYLMAVVLLIPSAWFFDPVPIWALLIAAIAPCVVGELVWSLTSQRRPRCPDCGADWTHSAFLRWDSCAECGLSLSPPPNAA